ncbi:hypothetical protein PM10SUCC1_05260 [Propionigenium maris DSM 9537]|uniref:EAL domain-containing protein n=1 Tax=Propionigenium maris DSM 9537 TaxID=1123000 RepID=A0A9W6GJQ7_9FUSO|nr:hypothetical protein [Propionigenium maris]GLI55011.1 hypothetical protein PM10SUCC1_05260 [Propionigenium maris DSM 9537]
MAICSDLKKAIEDVKINFVPVRDLETNEIYGYKVIKEFPEDMALEKEEIYDWVYDENFFEFFISKIKDKALKIARERGYLDKKFFYTLRVNYIKDSDFLFSNIESMLNKYQLSKENICFEIKGFKDWSDVEEILDYVEEGYEILIKEGNQSLDRNLLSLIEPHMVEVSSLENRELIETTKSYGGKIIYKIKENEKIDEKNLREVGVDLIYKK